jgi:hypothetical protein
MQFDIFRRNIQRPLKFAKLVQKASETKGMYSPDVIVQEE